MKRPRLLRPFEFAPVSIEASGLTPSPDHAPPGQPLELIQPESLRFKAFEPVMVIGRNKIKGMDIRVRVKGGGRVSQIYGKPTAGRASVVHPALLAQSC